MLWTSQTERSLMKCLSFLDSTFQLALILYSIRLHPILMSILLYHYKQLRECISEVERIEVIVNSKKKWLTKEEAKEEKEEVHATLDTYFIKNNANL